MNVSTPEPENQGSSKPIVGILIFPELLEDWLQHIDISFDAFLDEMMGSWMFGYFESLKAEGIEPVMIGVSDGIRKTERYVHRPTGAAICLLPATRMYKAIRVVRDAFQGTTFMGSQWIRAALRITSAYLSTPLLSFWRELNSTRYASILVQDYETARFDVTVLAGKLTGIPVFASFQGGGGWRKLFHFIRSQSMKNCDGLIIAAGAEAERVKVCYGLPPGKIARIYNPLAMNFWTPQDKQQARAKLGIPREAEVGIWHGRVDLDQKGLDILIKAWEQVCRSRPSADLRLILIGIGPDSEQLDSIVQNSAVRGVYRINKWIHDTTVIRQYLRCADVFVFPSRYEGFPVAPMEAMACGLPIVASAASGMRDILPDGWKSGGIVAPCEDSNALSLGIVRLFDDATWRAEVSRRARSRIEAMFSPNAAGNQLADVLAYRDMVRNVPYKSELGLVK